MKLIDADTAAATTGGWKAVKAGVYTPVVSIASAGTVTLQFSMDGSTSLGNLKDPDGVDYSFTASAAPRYGQAVPSGFVRATTSGVSGGAVTVWFQPINVELGNTGLE